MNTMGFPISYNENEKRRAMVPNDIKNIKNSAALYFEQGYGEVLGFSDNDYKNAGANVVTREEVLSQDIICDPKIGDAEYLDVLKGQTIFGWVHAVQNRDITDKLIKGKLTAYAWEEMFDRGRHVFWRNNELAGEAAVMYAFQCYGKMPYETNVAVLGNGNTARGAVKVLNMLGAQVVQYNRKMEQLLRDEIGNYDVIVNCILWDVMRIDHIINRSDLKRMKRGALIIDVSCDRNGGIETSIPTTIEKPIYFVDGIMHFVVDHTPSLFYKTFSFDNSATIKQYIEMLIEGKPNSVLCDAKIIEHGKILDTKIIKMQGITLK